MLATMNAINDTDAKTAPTIAHTSKGSSASVLEN